MPLSASHSVGPWCRFSQLRARKLAEAAAQVAKLLLGGNQVVNAALAAPDATPEQLQQLLGQVR